MAIINVTQKNFSKLASENLDKMGGMGLLAASLMGGKDKMKEALADVPDENILWVNTDHVVAVSGMTKIAETGDLVFRIFFRFPNDDKENAIWVKGDDYKRFILTWAGEVKSINEGEYEVPSGYRVVVSEDGSKVAIEKKED
jgi:hypothetical protein